MGGCVSSPKHALATVALPGQGAAPEATVPVGGGRRAGSEVTTDSAHSMEAPEDATIGKAPAKNKEGGAVASSPPQAGAHAALQALPLLLDPHGVSLPAADSPLGRLPPLSGIKKPAGVNPSAPSPLALDIGHGDLPGPELCATPSPPHLDPQHEPFGGRLRDDSHAAGMHPLCDEEEEADEGGVPSSVAVLTHMFGLDSTPQPRVSGSTATVGSSSAGGGAGDWHEVTQKPAADEIILYARQLGMDLARDSDLLWIAEQALQAPLPTNWSQYYDNASGNDYFVNDITGVTTWEHPLDEHFRALYVQMSGEKEAAAMKAQLADVRRVAKQRAEERRVGFNTAAGGGGGRQGQRGGTGARWSESTMEDSFYTAAGTDMDDSRSTFADSKDFTMSRTMDFSATADTMGFSDTYDSLNMSLSNSRVGGLQLNLLGKKQRALGKQSRGGGLGLELKVHGSNARHSAEKRQSAEKRPPGKGPVPVFSKGDVGQHSGKRR